MQCAKLSKCIVDWLEMHLEWQIFSSGTPRKMMTTTQERQDKKEKRDNEKEDNE